MAKKLKLFVLRLLIIGVLAPVVLVKRLQKKSWHKYANLLHYLIGSGRTKVLEPALFKEAMSALQRAISRYRRYYCHNGKPSICGVYFVNHSTQCY